MCGVIQEGPEALPASKPVEEEYHAGATYLAIIAFNRDIALCGRQCPGAVVTGGLPMTVSHGILARAALSLGLVVVVVAVWVLSGGPTSLRDWLGDIASGLLVLALAGIWVSYFAERQAARSLTSAIDSRFTILDALLRAKISNVFYSQGAYESRHDKAFRDRILAQLEKAKGDVWMMAVCAGEFLRQGGFAYSLMEDFVGTPAEHGSKLKLLLLHPLSEQAVSRALRESERCDFATYRQSTLWSEVLDSCSNVVGWLEKKQAVEARLYTVFPACFLLFINDVVFVEPYHFGEGGRASGKVPVFEVAQGGRYYDQLKGHFDHAWETSSKFKLDSEMLRALNDPAATEGCQFTEMVKCLRPDLFPPQP